MCTTLEFLEAKRRSIEQDVRAFLADKTCRVDEITYVINTSGDVVGGRVWISEQTCHWCLTESFLFSIYGDSVVASELFSPATQDGLTKYFAERHLADTVK